MTLPAKGWCDRCGVPLGEYDLIRYEHGKRFCSFHCLVQYERENGITRTFNFVRSRND